MDAFTNLLACSVCMTEIPESEAISAEATDYVAYFCGLECYAAWRDHAPGDSQAAGASDSGLSEAA